MEERIQGLANLWGRWNRREMDGRDFALAFGRVFHSECMAAWNISSGLVAGDTAIYRLSEVYFEGANLKGFREGKARQRRFQIIEDLPNDCLQVCRLDLSTGRLERIHKSFLVAEEGGRDV